MAVTMKFHVLCCILLLLAKRCQSSLDEDIKALENDLRNEEAKRLQKKSISDLKKEETKRLQKKSIADMTTEELIAELKKDEAMIKKGRSAKEKFHDITKTPSDDFEKLLKTNANDFHVLSSEAKKKSVETLHKKSMDSSKKQQSKDATHNVPAKTTKRDGGKNTDLMKRALQVIHDLTDTRVNDAEVQKKGYELLKELMEADKKAIENADAKETAKFSAALHADSVNMKKLADEKTKTIREKNVKKETKATKKDAKEIKTNSVEVQDAKDKVMKDIFELMADDLVKKIADEVAPKTKKEARKECKDKRSDCPSLAIHCDKKEKMQIICAKTCGYCKAPPEPPCRDLWAGMTGKPCEILKGAKRCREKNVDKYCAATCGYCKQPAAPKCSQTKYGCCWDRETTKMDAAGSNCQPCKDQYEFVCERFKVDCASKNSAGAFMRKNCKVTCNVCSAECKDDPQNAFYCPYWKKQLNWCKERPEIMKHFCPVTCGVC